jgi:hypothetical protein
VPVISVEISLQFLLCKYYILLLTTYFDYWPILITQIPSENVFVFKFSLLFISHALRVKLLQWLKWLSCYCEFDFSRWPIYIRYILIFQTDLSQPVTQEYKKRSKMNPTNVFKSIYLKKNCSIEFINLVRPSTSVRPSISYFFAILKFAIFKFWILREENLSTKSTAGFLDPKPRSSVIELRLGPSQIKVFSLYFINF